MNQLAALQPGLAAVPVLVLTVDVSAARRSGLLRVVLAAWLEAV